MDTLNIVVPPVTIATPSTGTYTENNNNDNDHPERERGERDCINPYNYNVVIF